VRVVVAEHRRAQRARLPLRLVLEHLCR
jgi:hypothetical protein